jgi:hypothetical protein
MRVIAHYLLALPILFSTHTICSFSSRITPLAKGETIPIVPVEFVGVVVDPLLVCSCHRIARGPNCIYEPMSLSSIDRLGASSLHLAVNYNAAFYPYH